MNFEGPTPEKLKFMLAEMQSLRAKYDALEKRVEAVEGDLYDEDDAFVPTERDPEEAVHGPVVTGGGEVEEVKDESDPDLEPYLNDDGN